MVALTSVALALVAHREVSRLAVDAAGERLRSPVNELASMLGNGPQARLAAVRGAADNLKVRALLAGDDGARNAAREVLQTLQRETPQLDGVELVTPDGKVLISVESPIDSLSVPTALRSYPRVSDLEATDATVSNIQFADSVQWIDLTAPVPGAQAPMGYVVRRRRLLPASPQTLSLVNNLIGPRAQLAVGHPASGWTDFRGGQGGPRASDFKEGVPVTYVAANGEPMIGRAAAIPHTPWYVWVESPLAAALAGTRSFLRDLLFGGLFVVLGGAALGALVSRRLSRPIEALTTAAQAVAAGEYQRRVETFGPGEIGALGVAFNRMADQVAEGRRTLEARVADRTMLLEGYVERLSESEERFRQLATSAADAIVISDGDGSIAYVNPAGELMFGYEPGTLVGRSVSDLVPVQHRRAHSEGHANYVRTGRRRTHEQVREMPALRRDGTEFPAELTITGWTQGNSRAVAAILRDVTERRRLTDELEQHARELEETNAELAAFSYSVSHDLRAPLRSIHGFTQALLDDHAHALNDEGRDYARRVHAAAERMSNLIDDLLELSRVSRTSVSRKAVDLVQLADAFVDELRRREPHRVVKFNRPPRLEVIGDERMLRQVMQNLIENAWKFSAPRATAIIELQPTQSAESASVTVRDNGVGFDSRYASKLFGVFQRLHSHHEFPGTGVGLAIVQRIVQRHGGRVWAESTLDEGAAFHFTLGTGGHPS